MGIKYEAERGKLRVLSSTQSKGLLSKIPEQIEE